MTVRCVYRTARNSLVQAEQRHGSVSWYGRFERFLAINFQIPTPITQNRDSEYLIFLKYCT